MKIKGKFAEINQECNLNNIMKIVPLEREEYLKTCQKEFYQILSEEAEMELDKKQLFNFSFLLSFIKISNQLKFNYTSHFLKLNSDSNHSKIDFILLKMKDFIINILRKKENEDKVYNREFNINLRNFVTDYLLSEKIFTKYEYVFNILYEIKDVKSDKIKKILWLLFIKIRIAVLGKSRSLIETILLMISIFLKFINYFPTEQIFKNLEKDEKKNNQKNSQNNIKNSNNITNNKTCEFSSPSFLESEEKENVNNFNVYNQPNNQKSVLKKENLNVDKFRIFRKLLLNNLSLTDDDETNDKIRGFTTLINKEIEKLKLSDLLEKVFKYYKENNSLEMLMNKNENDNKNDDEHKNADNEIISSSNEKIFFNQLVITLTNEYEISLNCNAFNESMMLISSQSDQSPIKIKTYTNRMKNIFNNEIVNNINNNINNNNNSMNNDNDLCIRRFDSDNSFNNVNSNNIPRPNSSSVVPSAFRRLNFGNLNTGISNTPNFGGPYVDDISTNIDTPSTMATIDNISNNLDINNSNNPINLPNRSNNTGNNMFAPNNTQYNIGNMYPQHLGVNIFGINSQGEHTATNTFQQASNSFNNLNMVSPIGATSDTRSDI